ncbi:MAG: hypothetical protein PHR87_14470, partial [Sulfurospirillaceae bacterium]|nr:hypothetical protein [Sulfurospirillaceae bacterium]
SVFAPLFAILLSDYFFFKQEDVNPALQLHVGSLMVWAIGVFLYYQFISLDLVIGSTLPTMITTALLFALSKKGMRRWIVLKK